MTISISAENHGDADGEVPLIIDGEEHMTLEVLADDQASDAFAHYFYEEGTYDIVFGGQNVTVNVGVEYNGEDDNENDDDRKNGISPEDDNDDESGSDDTPGFTLMVIAVSLVLAVLIHRKNL